MAKNSPKLEAIFLYLFQAIFLSQDDLKVDSPVPQNPVLSCSIPISVNIFPLNTHSIQLLFLLPPSICLYVSIFSATPLSFTMQVWRAGRLAGWQATHQLQLPQTKISFYKFIQSKQWLSCATVLSHFAGYVTTL